MKVCFISHTSAKGGAEKALLELIEVLKERVECYVILPRSGPLIEEFKKRKITYSILPYGWWMGKKFPRWKRVARIILNLFAWIPLTLRIKLWKCEIVYTNTITVCVGALAAKILKLPHVWHIHEFGYEDHSLIFDFGTNLSLWFMNNFSDIVIANSHAVAEKYKKYIPLSKIKVIYYSVNVPKDLIPNKMNLQKDKKIRCAIVGSLQEGKRQEEAILAMKELINKGVESELLIIGKGDLKYEKFLRELVIKNKLLKYVKFLGWFDNPFLIMNAVDVILVCSVCEAFGRVTIEAMKLGKPVIGARSGGTAELIQDGFNGFLYTPGDYRELAEKIFFVYEHPEIAKKIAENGKRWADQNFTPEKYGSQVFAVLNNLLARR